ncbi:CobW/nitrile hydratase activator like P-loop ATpase [Cryptosporidium ryanae]|uniref:CobW/nitrile hydratase activator like P-loop ATpase n=1 Tax=Cryptosporidium ryanae TaxID=515981 RepID=UPI00351A7B3D|nr:CobW/nitrile hydratase activator like P-loop ATpase [Cryptosporidium ryanae]
MKKTPIYIITGFLGSGKTTLIRQIINNTSDLKIAIIQNDFSDEMGIEAPTMTDKEGNIFKEFFELPNGCVCCTVKDELLKAVEYLLKKKEFDKILVETTGVADPEPIIEKFWVDCELDSNTYLSGVITVVDLFYLKKYVDINVININSECKSYINHENNNNNNNEDNLSLSSELIKQIMLANKIILNKFDLFENYRNSKNDSSIYDIENIVRKINPSANIIITSKSNVKMDWLFNMDSYNIHKIKGEIDEAFNNKIITYHFNKSISPSISSFTFSFDSVYFSHRLIEKVIADIAWNDLNCGEVNNNIGKLIRYKGLFHSKDSSDNHDSIKYFALQGVGEIFEVLPVEIPKDEPITCSKFFFLGIHLDGSEIKRLIESCII